MANTYKSILVGVELHRVKSIDALVPTADSEAAVLRATDLAKAHGSSLTLLHAFDVDPSAREWLEKGGEGPGTYFGEAKAALERLRQLSAGAGVKGTTRLCFGKPTPELSKAATHGGHDLLVVGARRPANRVSLYALRHALLGTTANQLLRQSAVPVWIVRPVPRPYARVLIATDLTELGMRVLDHALRIAVLDDADVHVVHAVDRWLAGRTYLLCPASKEIEARLVQELPAMRDRLAGQVRAAAAVSGYVRQPTLHVELMSPEELILRVARIENVDLVAMGTAARQGVSGFVVGNTCERILPELSCALLAAR